MKIILPKEIRRENIEGADLLDFCFEEVDYTFRLENVKKLHFEEEGDVRTTKNNPTPIQQRSKSINSLVDVSDDESINCICTACNNPQKMSDKTEDDNVWNVFKILGNI